MVGIGRPHGEVGARCPFMVHKMGAEFVVEAKVAAFVEKIQIVLS
jgi:hypothetical protein